MSETFLFAFEFLMIVKLKKKGVENYFEKKYISKIILLVLCSLELTFETTQTHSSQPFLAAKPL